MLEKYNKSNVASSRYRNRRLPLQPSNKLTKNLKSETTQQIKIRNSINIEATINTQTNDKIETDERIEQLEEECIKLVQSIKISEEKDYDELSAEVELLSDLSINEDITSEYASQDGSQDNSFTDTAQHCGFSNLEKVVIPDDWVAHVVNEKDSNLVSIFYSDSEISSSSSDYGLKNDNTEKDISSKTDYFRKKKLKKTFEDIDKQIALDSFIEGVEKNITTETLQKLAQQELQQQAKVARIIDKNTNLKEKKEFKYFLLDTKLHLSDPKLNDIPSIGPDDSIEADSRKDKLPTIKDLARLYKKALKE